MRIGVIDAAMQTLLKHYHAGSFCAITAANPHSQQRCASINKNRNAELEKDLHNLGAQRSWLVFPASNQPDDDSWPAEPGFVVLNMPLNTALMLAEKYQQNALVWADESARPELYFCGESSRPAC